MSRLGRSFLYGMMLALFVLHNDPWLQVDSRRVLGLPIGLIYHLALCVLATVVLALMVRHVWPRHLDEGAGAARHDADDGGGAR